MNLTTSSDVTCYLYIDGRLGYGNTTQVHIRINLSFGSRIW